MKILLIDIDSKIPNLALMKLSAWHKNQGDDVYLDWHFGKYDKIYASCIFKENRYRVNELIFSDLIVGGSGMEDWSMVLPDEIEHTKPDYELYNCSYSMGFASRGCLRKCPFCIVPQKEGKLRKHSDIYEWWDRSHKLLIFLDNNILGLREHFFRICEQILRENLKIDFNQGLDIRLMDDEIAKILHSLRHIEYRFSFDDPEDEEAIRCGIDLLKKYGLKKNMFFVLVGFNTSMDQDLYRLNVLRNLGQDAYVMRYRKGDIRTLRLAQWANQHHIFHLYEFEEFIKIKNGGSGIKRPRKRVGNLRK